MSGGRATRSKNPVLETGLKFYERSRTTDGRPDIKALYDKLDEQYFDGDVKLAGFSVGWGHNMLSSSGVTDFRNRTVHISWEAHQLLSESDRIGAILHEMIHVKLLRHRMDEDSKNHTGMFVSEMNRINKMGPYKVRPIHKVPKEVKEILHKHVWKCCTCDYILRLPTAAPPGFRNRHFPEKNEHERECDNPSWVKL